MNVTIVGTGYVGLTAGVCLAELGHSVASLDIDTEKIARLQRGECVIYEEGLEELLKKNLAAGRIRFTADPADAMTETQVVIFAVPTPEGEYGKANLSFLLDAAQTCARHQKAYCVYVNKSTAPVGSVARMKEAIAGANGGQQFDVASNPEFMAEGTAVKNFLQPDRIVIGTENATAENALRQLYAPLTQSGTPIVATTVQSAELIKYAANSFLALKISFMNEIADFAERVGADITEIARGIGADRRIGPNFLRAGIGYGGSCFGKDVKALAQSGEERGFEFKIIKALSTVNDLRYRIILDKLAKHHADISGTRIAVLGLAYKPETDDVRDAPSLRIIHELLARNAQVSVYDPAAMDAFRRNFSQASVIHFADSAPDCIHGADAILLLTEWNQFKDLDLGALRETVRNPLIIDGRNLFDRTSLEAAGFVYEGVGR